MSADRPGNKPVGSRIDAGIALLFGIAYFVLLCLTLDIGIPRDESFYFAAGEQYSRWFDDLADDPANAFSKEVVDKRFGYNGEHPALPKILFGASWRLFGKMHDPKEEPWARTWYDGGKPPAELLGLVSESTAFRLPALLVSSLLVVLVYLFGVEFFNRRVAFGAALFWMFTPHAFWHAHLSCFDMPIAVLWFLTAWCFLKAEAGGWRWAIATGVAWALALSTKHNAFFLPIVFVVWFLATRWREFGMPRDGGGVRLKLPTIPLSFFAMLVISPILYYALWPRLWHEPIKHFKWYLSFHMNHVMYWAYFFGHLYTKPPYPVGYSFLMHAITTPVPTVLLSIVGLGMAVAAWISGRLRSVSSRIAAFADSLPVRGRGTLLFVFLNFFIPFLAIATPKVPIFGGTKHWLPGVPFLALFAGLAFDRLLVAIGDLGSIFPRLSGRLVRAGLVGVVAVALFAPAAFDTLHGYTNGSTYFNAFTGGFGAMGRHRLQREFWGNSSYLALDWLNENAKKGARVDFHDTTHDAVRFYWRDGLLRRDIVPAAGIDHADILLFHWHKEFLDKEADARLLYDQDVPAAVFAQDGVPLLNVWARKGALASDAGTNEPVAAPKTPRPDVPQKSPGGAPAAAPATPAAPPASPAGPPATRTLTVPRTVPAAAPSAVPGLRTIPPNVQPAGPSGEGGTR